MDRFSSREDMEWNKGCFDDGALARLLGSSIDSHPSADTIGEFAVKSWRAGWCDADADLASKSPKEEIARLEAPYDPKLDDLDDPASLEGLSLGAPYAPPAQPDACDSYHGDGKSHEDADSNHRVGVCRKCGGSPFAAQPDAVSI
jgi:hypothetical protein